MFGSIISVVLAAVAVGLLILVHETGHFLAAKAVGVRVEVFSVGFWKKLLAFKRGDTEYRLSLIPLGGYVRLAGDVRGETTGAPDEFYSKSPGQRAVVFVAGVVMNVVLGLIGFIVAFSLGVPFLVAEVGVLQKGWPAWQAGLRKGDVIERINDISDPDFEDVQRAVALQGLDEVSVTVNRDGRRIDYELPLRYDPRLGVKRIGFAPPTELIVTGLFRVGGQQGRCPAEEAGMKLGDRIVSVNGREVRFVRELAEELHERPHEELEVVVERGDRDLTFRVITESSLYWIGISCVSSTIESLQEGGMAKRLGLRAGDRITSVNGKQVRSIVEVEGMIQDVYGPVEFRLERSGKEVTVRAEMADEQALRDFLFSLECTTSNELAWVKTGTPAWEAGMRSGDRIVEVAGRAVESWEEILEANASDEPHPRLIRWVRGGQAHSAQVTPVRNAEDPQGSIGCIFNRGKQRIRRHGILQAVRTGFYKTYGTVTDIFLTLRGFVRRDLSTRNLGGVALIAYASYRAAQQGMGKLLYLTAMISIGLAFINILPIPILDGGHLLFVAIEKLRGKPMGERVRMVSQAVGLTLLVALLLYVLKNDIVRLFDLG